MIPDHDEGISQLKYAYDQGINVSPDCSSALLWTEVSNGFLVLTLLRCSR